ncbi:MAG TPA: divalent-cation tolerance protein CutA [Gemmatimonadales bacterium]|nr:divalent-cation tolerance protein CutA [Gemmatimonadales bacterium]
MAIVIVVSTSLPSREAADRLARTLVDERLAACVQVSGPVRSTYRWRGALEITDEWRCEIKTTDDAWPRARDRIIALHSYEVPEILMTRAEASAAYAEWVGQQVGSEK